MNTNLSKPFVSVIIPVKNAEKFLAKCLESLNNLDYPKDRYEVIISDSDSTDRTRIIADSGGARVIMADGPSVCAGRNSGFKVAKGDIIAFSDADCIMDKEWISNAIKYFDDEKVGCVGGPSLIPEDETAFGKACGFIFSYSLFTGGSTYGRSFNKALEVSHNPGCNAIYRRSALERVMPVDEEFVEGEDVMMNKLLGRLGYKFLFTPDTKLRHYRSSTPKRFFKQNIRYGVGRVLLGRRDRELINPMHILVGFSLPLLAIAIITSLAISVSLTIILTIFGITFLSLYTFLAFIKTRSFKVALNVPFAIILLMAGWSIGFMKETCSPSHRKG
ncbi:MAG: glycosyltransferase [Candidatus Omnitrophota bacterium]